MKRVRATRKKQLAEEIAIGCSAIVGQASLRAVGSTEPGGPLAFGFEAGGQECPPYNFDPRSGDLETTFI